MALAVWKHCRHFTRFRSQSLTMLVLMGPMSHQSGSNSQAARCALPGPFFQPLAQKAHLHITTRIKRRGDAARLQNFIIRIIMKVRHLRYDSRRRITYRPIHELTFLSKTGR